MNRNACVLERVKSDEEIVPMSVESDRGFAILWALRSLMPMAVVLSAALLAPAVCRAEPCADTSGQLVGGVVMHLASGTSVEREAELIRHLGAMSEIHLDLQCTSPSGVAESAVSVVVVPKGHERVYAEILSGLPEVRQVFVDKEIPVLGGGILEIGESLPDIVVAERDDCLTAGGCKARSELCERPPFELNDGLLARNDATLDSGPDAVTPVELPIEDLIFSRCDPITQIVQAPRDIVCIGDCNEDGSVTIEELEQIARISRGEESLQACPTADLDGDRNVSSDELLALAQVSLHRCPTACELQSGS